MLHQVGLLPGTDETTLAAGRLLDGWVVLGEDSIARVADYERGDGTKIQAVPEAAYRKAMGAGENLFG